MEKWSDYLLAIPLYTLYVVNIPVIVAVSLLIMMGFELKYKKGSGISSSNRIILLLVATIFSLSFYMALAYLDLRYGIDFGGRPNY